MAKRPTITTVTTGFQSGATMNANFEALRDGFDNTLSLDGSTPNAMGADLDMNNNDILNVGSIQVQGVALVPNNAATIPDWEGVWLTGTSYSVNDLVRQDGNVYICLISHTAGTFSTDLAAARWELFASKGDSGAGTGDLLAANNLSDLADTDSALSNLGGGTVGIALFKDTTAAAARTEISAQESNANLTSLAGITLQAGDLLYATGANTLVRLAKGTADQVLTMNDGATAPNWETFSPTVVGVGQSWASASRTAGVSYQNTTGKAIQISARVFTTITGGEVPVTTTGRVEVSANGSTWVTVGSSGSINNDSVVVTAIVPNDHYYRYSNGTFLAILS
jgi:hypothetical protein